MDDKVNNEENQSQPEFNQPTPIFEVSAPEDNIQPEEIPDDANVLSKQEATQESPPTEIDGNIPEMPLPIYEESKLKYFVIIGGVIFFILIFIFILKFISGAKGPAKNIELIYWGLWEDSQSFDPLIQSYQQKNSYVKIKYEKMSPQEYLQKLIVRSQKGLGPDIFRYHNTWLPEVREVVAPLPQQIVSIADFDKLFYPIQQKDLKIGDYYYGIPLEIDGLVLIANESLFKKAGINVVVSNWEQVLDSASKLTVKNSSGKVITSGIALGTASNVEHFADIFGWMLLQNGGDLKKLDDKEAIDALESYRQFAEPPNNFWDEEMPNSITAFIQEKVAMIVAPSWELLTIKAANPDIKIKVLSLPAVPGTKPISLASYWVEGVSKYSKNQLEAWKFLRFLIEKDNLTKMYETEAKTRIFGEPYARVDLASLLVQNEYIGAVIAQANNYQSLPLITKTYDNGLNDEIIRYLENAINSIVNGVAYNQAAKTAATGVAQVFSKYKIN